MNRQQIEDAWDRLDEQLHEEEDPVIPNELAHTLIDAIDALTIWLKTQPHER